MNTTSKKINDRTIVIGCGRLGASLAGALSDAGRSVLVMDRETGAFHRLPSSIGGLAVIGDGTDLDVLREADIEKADTVIAVTNNDNANILIAQAARELFRVPHIIARLYDAERECVYRELGIATICPTLLSARYIDKLWSLPKEEIA